MVKRCPDCERPVGNRWNQCPAQLLFAVEADKHACARVVALEQRSRIAKLETMVDVLKAELANAREQRDKWCERATSKDLTDG